MHAYDPAYVAASNHWAELGSKAEFVRSTIYLAFERPPCRCCHPTGASSGDLGGFGHPRKRRSASRQAGPRRRPRAGDPRHPADPTVGSQLRRSRTRLEARSVRLPRYADEWRLHNRVDRAHTGPVAARLAAANLDSRGRPEGRLHPPRTSCPAPRPPNWVPPALPRPGSFPSNGYKAEWEHVAAVAYGIADPAIPFKTVIADLHYALAVADGAEERILESQ
jgi:hypothetical protein